MGAWKKGGDRPDGGAWVVGELALDETQHDTRLAGAHLAEQHDLHAALAQPLAEAGFRGGGLLREEDGAGLLCGRLCVL